jgi:hypothetical protein
MSRFADYIQGVSVQPATPMMPLTHVCQEYFFREILETKRLKPSPCRVFAEELLYFFYGKPAYTPKTDGAAVDASGLAPVCLVCKPRLVPHAKRIAPFDTGAFASGRYSDYLHQKMKIDDFLLDGSPEMPGRIVAHFFSSNSEYFKGKPATIQIPPTQFEARAYHNLITDNGKTSSDHRRSAIEIQTDLPLTIERDSVLLVVLPEVFLDDPDVRIRVFQDWSAEVVPYPTYHCDPEQYQGAVAYVVSKFLREKHFI